MAGEPRLSNPAAVDGIATSSYRDDDVTLLFTDLTGVVAPIPMAAAGALARSTRGTGHRTVVPVEDPPSSEAISAFTELLAAGAHRAALLGCVLARRIIAHRRSAHEIVLASIARAGTPIGVVLNRLLRLRYQRAVTHYSISLVPGLGIDDAALRYILARHRPESIRFVDGWSGKGGIAKILRAELARAAPNVSLAPDLAMLTDPGSASSLCATRDDVLLASAVLNAPVSGGFSRSFRPALLGPDDFHAVIRYPELAGYDVSRRFVDSVCAAAQEIDESEVDAALAAVAAAGPATFGSWGFAEALAGEFHAPTMLSFVKPGLNEVCRTLVVREPALVLVDPSQAGAQLAVIRRLAGERGVPVRERVMPYAAVGIAFG